MGPTDANDEARTNCSLSITNDLDSEVSLLERVETGEERGAVGWAVEDILVQMRGVRFHRW